MRALRRLSSAKRLVTAVASSANKGRPCAVITGQWFERQVVSAKCSEGGHRNGGSSAGGSSSSDSGWYRGLGTCTGIVLAACVASPSDERTRGANCLSTAAERGSGTGSGMTKMDVKQRQRQLNRMSTVGGRIEDSYDIGEQLGEGGYGTVHMGTHRRTGKMVAVKIMQKKHMGKSSFNKEVSTLRKIHDAGGHPHIAGVESIYEDVSNYYLVLELVSGGEMFEHLVRNGAYSEKTAAALIRDLAAGLAFLHSHGIVHADLKPENVMLSSWDDRDARVKLVDFGCAGTVGDHCDATAMGTTAYWPPEAMCAAGFRLTPAMDTWAVGVILYIMLTGMHPFDLSGDTPEDEIMSKVAREDVPLSPDVVGHLSESAKDLIRRLMDRNPARRLTAEQMARHLWVTGEAASEEILDKIDEKLAHYQQTLKQKLETGLFALLVQQSVSVGEDPEVSGAATATSARAVDNVEEAVDVIKKAFSVFDKEKKGFVSASDIARVLEEVGEGELTDQERAEVAQALEPPAAGDGFIGGVGQAAAVAAAAAPQAGISIDSFEKMMSCLGTVKFKAGDYIFREGDAGDYMYFINSGRVDVFKEAPDGKEMPCRITTLGPGDLFGEAALITNDPRSASVKCITPVQVVRIGRESVQRIMKDAKGASASLREMAVLREMNRAKAVLRAVGRVVQKCYRPGETVVQQGSEGKSMFTVVSGKMDVVMTPPGQQRTPVKVATIGPGDIFGEMALMLQQPRNASVICRGGDESGAAPDGGCIVKEIQGDDFMSLLKESPDFHKAMRCLMRTRQFRHDILRLGDQMGVSVGHYTEGELRRVFSEVDSDGSGLIDLEELVGALSKLQGGARMSADDARELLRMADSHLEGGISFDEFQRVMGWASGP